MAYQGNKFLFSSIQPDRPAFEDEPEQELSPEEQMALLESRLNEMPEELPLTYEKKTEDGKQGLNIHLPYGVDFRVENGEIQFSRFGLTKEELQHVYQYLHFLGFENVHFPEDESKSFKKLAKNALKDMRNKKGEYEVLSLTSTQNAPVSANDNQKTDSKIKRLLRKIRNKPEPVILPTTPEKKEEIHPNVDDIENFFNINIRVNQRGMKNDYRKIRTATGWKLILYKDADQKREGPTKDKSGRVNPNFDAGIRGDISMVDGKPFLTVTLLTPKYGDATDGMFAEAVGLAAACKSTHMRFKAPAGMRAKFLVACAKKMIVPVGAVIKVSDFNNMLKAAQENVDKTEQRVEYYGKLIAQLEADLQGMKDKNSDHPYYRMIKTLKGRIAAESCEEKFKRFNNFYEKLLQGKAILDGNDEPVDIYKVNSSKERSNPAKEMAMGQAYVELLAQYVDDSTMKDMTDKQLLEKYLNLYNKNLFLTHKTLKEKLAGLKTPREIKEAIGSEYQIVQRNINAIQAKVAYEGYDKLSLPKMDKYTRYDAAEAEANMQRRLRLGRNEVVSGRLTGFSMPGYSAERA